MRRSATVICVALFALLLASCGTRADRAAFYRALAQSNQTAGTSETTGGGAAPATTGTAKGGSASSSAGSAASRQSGGTLSSSVAQAASAVPNVSTKEFGSTIRIGVNIPETGAAPLPTNYRDSINAIQQWWNNEGQIAGRKIEFVIEDDGYDAEKGLAACKKLAGENIDFAFGHTMPAAEDVCAGYYGSRGIPYLMRGTYPQVLNNRPLAWFSTASDDLQGRLLADYVLKRLNGAGQAVAVVYQNDQQSAKDNFVNEIKAGGGKIVAVEQSVPRQADYAATIQKLQSAGAKYVLLSMPPVDAIKISVQGQGSGFHPTWLGGGTWWNYNLVMESAGAALDGAIVLSPWASVDSAGADQYRAVVKKYLPNSEPDDIGLVMWGWANLIRAALQGAGTHPSRATLVNSLNALRYSQPFWTPIAYSPSNHNGATSVAVFQGDGQAKRWRQISGFVSGF